MSRVRGELRFLPAVPDSYFRQRPLWAIDADPTVMTRLKRIFPRIRPNEAGQKTIVDTPEVARDLVEMVLTRYPLSMDEQTARHLHARAEQHRQVEQDVATILGGGRRSLDFDGDLIVEPFPDQLVAVDMLLTTGRLLLGDSVGMGKTYSALLTFRAPVARPGVVVVPSHLSRQWVAEAAAKTPWLRTHLVRKTAPYDAARTRGMRGYEPDLYIITYTMLHGWVDELAAQCKTVVFEEVHELRHPATRKYEAALELARAMEYRLGISASPVFNYGGEAHTVVNVLDGEILGSREEFVREWSVTDQGAKTRVTDPNGLGRHLVTEGIMLRRKRKQAPPQKVPHVIDSDTSVLDDATDVAAAMAELILSRDSSREQRFQASGEIDLFIRRQTGIAKAPYVAAFVRALLDSEDKVVLWGWHRTVYEIWLEALADFNPVMYTGSESPAQKQAAVDRFCEPLERYGDGEPDPAASRVMLMSLRSGAGVDGLQKVCNVGVFGELDWSPVMHDQCLGRLDPFRGVDPTIDVSELDAALGYFLHTDDGSDPLMMDVLGAKTMQSHPISNPDTPLFEASDTQVDRVKLLAQSVLDRRARRSRRRVAA